VNRSIFDFLEKTENCSISAGQGENPFIYAFILHMLLCKSFGLNVSINAEKNSDIKSRNWISLVAVFMACTTTTKEFCSSKENLDLLQ
jgi:hypothetical protein